MAVHINTESSHVDSEQTYDPCFLFLRRLPFSCCGSSRRFQMSQNPYQPPISRRVDDAAVPTSRLRLHPFGIAICAIAAFCVHTVSTKVPAGELPILRSPWLAAALALISLSMLVLCFAFSHRCLRVKVRAELLYLLPPIAMFGYVVFRSIAG